MKSADATAAPDEPGLAAAARHTEIAKVMAQVDDKRKRLAARLHIGDIDWADARRRNAQMPGRLGQLWGRFIELSREEQLAALEADTFDRMAWQSLLQCSPFLVGRP